MGIYNMPICRLCKKELFEIFFRDEIRRWRCLCSPDVYSEIEYILKPGENPVRRWGGRDRTQKPSGSGQTG